jgi:hypothetical protein
MDPAKIVISKVQGERRFQVFPLLREAICEPRKSSHRHSDI